MKKVILCLAVLFFSGAAEAANDPQIWCGTSREVCRLQDIREAGNNSSGYVCFRGRQAAVIDAINAGEFSWSTVALENASANGDEEIVVVVRGKDGSAPYELEVPSCNIHDSPYDGHP